MKKRAAIELSANALVIIIISIVILVLSIVLIRSMLGHSNVIVDQLDERTQNEIERMLIDPAARVALPVTQREVSRGNIAAFGLGVKNVIGRDEYFIVNIMCNDYISKTNVEMPCPPDAGSWVLGLNINQKTTIKNTKEEMYSISIQVPKDAQSGTYIYNLYVCYNDGDSSTPPTSDPDCYTTLPDLKDYYIDGNMKKLYVIVK